MWVLLAALTEKLLESNLLQTETQVYNTSAVFDGCGSIMSKAVKIKKPRCGHPQYL